MRTASNNPRKKKRMEMRERIIHHFVSALMGGDEDNIEHFYTTENTHLGGVPREMMKTEEGAIEVLNYVHWIWSKQ